MKARNFIEKYLSQCEDTIICLHDPTNCYSSMFSIYELNHKVIDDPNLIYDVSQITSRVENFNKSLNVVIHIYTEHAYEEAK